MSSTKSEDATGAQPDGFVSTADLEIVDFEAPVRGLATCDPLAFYMAYERAHGELGDQMPNSPQGLVYRLFGHLCSMSNRPTEPGNDWVPLVALANGGRSAVAEDFRGEQTAVLAGVVARIENPALRARVADICWHNNRRDGRSAQVAITAYCDVVFGLLDGSIKTDHGMPAAHDACEAMQRAIQLATLTTKRGKRPERVVETFEAVYTAAFQTHDIMSVVRLASEAMGFGLRRKEDVVVELERAGNSAPPEVFPDVVRQAWDMAADLYHQLGNQEARQRCLKNSADKIIAMREQVRGNPAAEASWLTDALLQLRHVQGYEDLKRDLELEVRRLQQESTTQFSMHQFELNLGKIPQEPAELFSNLSISDCLKRFAVLSRSRRVGKLRADALETARTTPLSALMPTVYYDADGRPESKSSGAPFQGNPDETWFRRHIGFAEKVNRQSIVVALIDPARAVMQARFGISERHIRTIVELSPFIPRSQTMIVTLGFIRLFQLDMISATHLLFPQLEPCLRHILRVNGHDPSKRRDDSTEEDLSLTSLLSGFRGPLETILGVDLTSEIDLLFNAKPGPELRHEIAHGQMSAGGCYDVDAYYGCWLIYQITCLFVVQDWDNIVAPRLAGTE